MNERNGEGERKRMNDLLNFGRPKFVCMEGDIK